MRTNAEFVISVVRLDQLPKDRLPEIALAGRSNVGKSSLINTLLGQPGLARTSNTPGRTQTLNYYRVTPEPRLGKPFFLVDMPGYGYAAINQTSRAQWADLIEQYLEKSSMLCGIMHLIDLRHPPMTLDHSMSQYLQEHKHNYMIVGTKSDKVAKTKVPESLLKVAESLNIDSRDTLAFSAQTGFGREQLWRWVMDTAQAGPPTL